MAKFKFQDLVINVDTDDDGVPLFNFGCGPQTNPQGCGGGTNQGGGQPGCEGATEPGCGGGTKPGCDGGTQPGCDGGTNPMGGCGGGTKQLFGVRLDSADNIRALRDKLREVIGQLDALEQGQGGGN